MAREDYSNRTRETLHRNWLFDETDVILSGQGEQLKDTFIYNQSWWTKNSKCHSYFYKLQDGATSGHSHAYPKDREELVLGLMNRFRNPLGERGNSRSDSTPGTPFKCTDAWSSHRNAYGWDSDGNYMPSDSAGQNWFEDGTYGAANSDDWGYWCHDRPRATSSAPEHCFEYDLDGIDYNWFGQDQQMNVWYWHGHDGVQGGHCELGENGSGTPGDNQNRAAGRDPDDGGEYECGSAGSDCTNSYKTNNITHVVNYEDVAIWNACLNAGGDFWPNYPGYCDEIENLEAYNGMKNQPPSKERTPFRPIFLCDLRTPDNPAVPEGGFIRTAKLILTVSQQSIAWPRQGFTAEIYNLSGSSTTENANWWSYKGTPDIQLGHDGAGNTLGDWYSAVYRDNPDFGIAWDTTFMWLPDPIHKAIFPKDNPEWTWGLKADSGHAYQTDDGWKYAPMMTSEANSERGYNDDPHWRACLATGKIYGWGYNNLPPSDAGGYYNQQLLISPAYDGETSFTTNDVNGDFGQDCTGYGLWAPMSWREDKYGFSNVPVSERGCSAGNWHGRASEVEGLTGCGGCIEILPGAGFTNDVCLDGSETCSGVGNYPEGAHYADDGLYYDYTGNRITSEKWDTEFVPEWTPITRKNYKNLQIPKFTNAGYSGSYMNLTTVPNSGEYNYATGGTGSYDGRGITFAIELDDFARHAIANKDQKLHLIMKGEYKNMPINTGVEIEQRWDDQWEITAINQEAQYESAGILYLRAGHTGCRDCEDEITPGVAGGGGNSDNTLAQNKDWRTDAAQLATNFFSVDSPAPSKTIKLNFHGKGSTMDWQSGDVGSITYGLQTTQNPNKEEYIQIEKFNNADSFDRFNTVFNKINATDNFTITDSGNLNSSCGHANGTYVAYKKEFNPTNTRIYVTGGIRLFNGCNNSERPEEFNNQVAKFTGTHQISIDGDCYIDNDNTATYFGNFYDDVDVQPDHSNQKAYPEFYSATEAMHSSGNGGLTGGEKDFLEINISSDNTHSNNGTYTITDVWFNNTALGINIERLKVKEKVVHQREKWCVVKRVNHRPRLEISYRSRHQYDATTSGGLHDP